MNLLSFRKVKRFFLIEVILRLADVRFKTKAYETYYQIKKMQRWSAAEVQNWQNSHLQQLIKHFYENTTYYKNLFDSIGLSPDDIKSTDDLRKIPPINKNIIKENYHDLIPKNISRIAFKKATTGGSTGTPLKYLLDLKSWSFTTAMKIYSWETKGYLYGDVYATVGSSSLFPTRPSIYHRAYHFFKSSTPISAMNMSETQIKKYIKLLRERRVQFIYGYAAAVYLMAKYLNDSNTKIKTVKGCFTTSEILTAEYRNEIEKAFGFVMDCYGARDGGVTAYEISQGNYHVGYNSFMEIKEGNELKKGTLLTTDLFSYSFPFIRYELGDEVSFSTSTTSDYNGQVISKVLGRASDIIRLENGHVLTGVGFQVMFGRMNVIAFRISKVGELHLLVEIEPNEYFTKDEENLIRTIFQNHAGQNCNIEIYKVKKFTPNKNGKRNYFMS